MLVAVIVEFVWTNEYDGGRFDEDDTLDNNDQTQLREMATERNSLLRQRCIESGPERHFFLPKIKVSVSQYDNLLFFG